MTNEEAKAFLQSRIDLIDKFYPEVEDYREALDMAIKALEQTRPKGKWSRPFVVAMPYLFAYECPICRRWGNIQTFEPNYCPNCGADMRESDKE